ncbi:MAG: urease accessory protein UreE [Pseudomonadota bacterium]
MTHRLAMTVDRGGADAAAQLTLTYEDRFLRRKVLTCDDGSKVLVDLAQTTSLNAGDHLVCEDGTRIVVGAADEDLLQITADRLLPVVWHIGNRHCPCQIEENRVLIQPDHVLADLMEKLGARVMPVKEPFTPEGGAYGHGRTHGHDHSHQHGPDHHHHD